MGVRPPEQVTEDRGRDGCCQGAGQRGDSSRRPLPQGDAKGLPTKERPCPGLRGAAEPACHRQPLPCPSLNRLWRSRAGDFYPLPQSQMLAGSKRHPEMEVGGALKREGAPCSRQEAEPQCSWVGTCPSTVLASSGDLLEQL